MISHTRQILRKKRRLYTLIGISLLVLLAVGIYFIPPIRVRVDNRLDTLRTQIKYLINPPENVVFVPTEKSQQTSTPSTPATATLTPLPDLPTVAPTITSTPLPTAVKMSNIVYANQCNRWNYCGPANLNMALKYWGWKGLTGSELTDGRDQIASIIKPGESDPTKDFIERGKSDYGIMPYEMVDFVNNYTSYRALYRYGGDLELLHRMIAAGFPVIIEKGYYQRDNTGRTSWMGHYSFVTGYDDTAENFVWQDSYPNRCADQETPSVVEKKGRDNLITYDDLLNAWRGFDYIFVVVYPAEHESDVMQALGPWADAQWAAQHALDIANTETESMTGNDQFFAWFNVGTSNVALQHYADAASAYDHAFTLYASLSNDDSQRPYRILWYETGPYWAYFYTGRYQDVINLADTTLNFLTSRPSLEESIYWRAMAKYALGQYDAAYADIRNAVYFNKNMQVALARMQEWGISP
jgi:hypothetical protein